MESLNFLIEESRAYGQEFLNSMALVVPVNPDDPESVKAADAKRREYHFNAAKAKIREQTLRDCVKLLQQLKKYAAESE